MLVHLFRLSLSALGFSALLLGCVTVPDVIKGTTATPQQDLNVVKNAPDIYTGQEARFGGMVVGVVNEQQRTRLEIVSIPLDAGGRPVLGKPSQGRLVAYVNKFIEPFDLKYHFVTVVGLITGIETGKIDMTAYDFVVITVTGYKRWSLQQQIVMSPGTWGFGPSIWGRGWSGYEIGPAKVQTIVTE